MAGKRKYFQGENKLIVRIPLIRRFSPIIIQPKFVSITIQLENLRVAIDVCNV